MRSLASMGGGGRDRSRLHAGDARLADALPVESAVTVRIGERAGLVLESRAQRPDCPNRS